jgi:hypothetical protein
MRIFKRSWLMLLAMAAGCAGATATTQNQSTPFVRMRPSSIVVYPFAADPSDITLNQSIIQRAYRDMSSENTNAQQTKLARDTAENVCLEIVSTLQKEGWSATCLERGTPPVGDNLLVVGFGAGASSIDTNVSMYQKSSGGYQKLLDFTTHAESGKMPGAAVTGGAGAAAGAGAAVIVGANAGLGAIKTYKSSTGELSDKTAKEVVDQLNGYFSQQGWMQTQSGT